MISGTPAGGPGTSNFTITVTDSASPAAERLAGPQYPDQCGRAGRNDSIADATPLGNGTHAASISPRGDPSGTLDPDEDYYRITTTATSTITIDINAQVNGSPLDAVIEIAQRRRQRS